MWTITVETATAMTAVVVKVEVVSSAVHAMTVPFVFTPRSLYWPSSRLKNGFRTVLPDSFVVIVVAEVITAAATAAEEARVIVVTGCEYRRFCNHEGKSKYFLIIPEMV
jgi:hypothetical protein